MHANRTSRSRGFSLVELMITVSIITVLAAVAMTAFKYQAQKAKLAQLDTFMAAIGAGQALAKAATGDYVGDSAVFCPSYVGAGPTMWDTACDPVIWSQVVANPPLQTYFQFGIIAGDGITAGDTCTPFLGVPETCDSVTAGEAWWVAVGRGDLDADGVLSTFITSYAMRGAIFKIDEHE